MMGKKDIRSNVRISAGSPYVSWVLLYTRYMYTVIMLKKDVASGLLLKNLISLNHY